MDKNGKDIAALVPIDDLEMIELIEDRIDLAEAKKILANPKVRSWEDFRKNWTLNRSRAIAPGGVMKRKRVAIAGSNPRGQAA